MSTAASLAAAKKRRGPQQNNLTTESISNEENRFKRNILRNSKSRF